MSTSATIPEIEGLPPGVTLRSLQPQIEGLPAGARLRAIQKAQADPNNTGIAVPANSGNYVENLISPEAKISAPESGATAFLDRLYHRVVTALGAESKPAGETIAGPVLGPIRTLRGISELAPGTDMQTHPMRGVNDVVGGVGQAVGLPAAVVAPGTMALAAPSVIAQGGVSKAATASGASPEAAEFAGNLAGVAAGGLTAKLAMPKTPAPAAIVEPHHVEALTGLIEDRAGTVDPHATATAALPVLRETAVRMKLDPAALKGREAGQAAVKVAEQAVRDAQNEFNTIKKPYENVLTEQKPIADAYRSAITDELRANEPKVARALEREAAKFDQPATVEQINQFRTRMNNQLNTFEKRGTTAQIMSDIETKAHKAAANAAREIEYQTVGRLSGVDPDYIQGLKLKEGSLIEAKGALEKEYNRASGAQGEAVSKTVREKAANIYPSPRGIKHAGIKEFIGPKPIDVLNNRLQRMFADMGAARPLPTYEIQAPQAPEAGPSGPVSGEDFVEEARRGGPGPAPAVKPDVATRQKVVDMATGARKVVPQKVADVQPPVVSGGQITPEHVAQENAFYTQARSELGANAEPMAVLRRAQQIKLEMQSGVRPPIPAVKPTLTQKVQAQPLPTLKRVQAPMPSSSAQSPSKASAASRSAQALAIMTAAKEGRLTPLEADRKLKQLIGRSGGKTIRRPQPPE